MIKSILISVALSILLGVASSLPTTSEAASLRIVNGTAARIEDIPFQVTILLFNTALCSGVILDYSTILTSANCLDYHFERQFPLTDFSIRAGSSYWATGGQLVGLKSVLRHDQYNLATMDYDIAIVKLNADLQYNDSVQPVVLAGLQSELTPGQQVQVSGWGRLSNVGDIPDILQKIVVPVVSQEECKEMFAHIQPVTDRMFCAGNRQGLGDSCHGDTGGPLVDVNNVLYGLVSGRIICAAEGYTGVYTSVSYFYVWIKTNW